MIPSRPLLAAAALAVLGGATPPGAVDPVPAPEQGLRLELNVPAYRLDLLVGGRLLWSYTVAVGMPRHPTPIREYAIGEIVWNPWWFPPPSDWARDSARCRRGRRTRWGG